MISGINTFITKYLITMRTEQSFIKLMFKTQGKTQSGLADAMGTKQSAISRIITSSNIAEHHRAAIANYLGFGITQYEAKLNQYLTGKKETSYDASLADENQQLKRELEMERRHNSQLSMALDMLRKTLGIGSAENHKTA